MKNNYAILHQLPHISISQANRDEHFELFKLGTFKVDYPLPKLHAEIPSP